MFMDELRCKVWEEIRQHDIRAFAKLLMPGLFAKVAEHAGLRLANSPLNLGNLVWLGIAAALQATLDFASVLTTTLRILEDQQNFYSTPLGKEKKSGNGAESAANVPSTIHAATIRRWSAKRRLPKPAA